MNNESHQPEIDIRTDISSALAGVGAVGSVWMHTVWACRGITGNVVLADNDKDGVDRTNLNRYALFGSSSIGKAKASEAARIAQDAEVSWLPQDSAFEDLPYLPDHVISAVDSNRARVAIQGKYPARILSASTLDLRAEVLRCGPPGEGACLRCFNRPEEIESDDAIRHRLGQMQEDDLEKVAEQAAVSKEDARTWIKTGKCGTATERLLPLLRQSAGRPRAWAVGFVSAMAGTLLAAETVRGRLLPKTALSNDDQRAVFQFWTPTSVRNTAAPYGRDINCPMCASSNPATKIWRDRYYAIDKKDPSH